MESPSSRRDRLAALIEEILAEAEKPLDAELTEETSLIQSGLLDSLAVLHLTEWIDQEMDRPLDLDGADIAEQWDTIERILAFIERPG